MTDDIYSSDKNNPGENRRYNAAFSFLFQFNKPSLLHPLTSGYLVVDLIAIKSIFVFMLKG